MCWKGGASGNWNQRGQFYTTGERGVCDLFALKNGRLLAIEIKVGRDSVRPQQQRFLDNIAAHGGVPCVARSLDDVIEALAQVDRCHGRPRADGGG